MAKSDPVVLAHLEWLGFVQPVGLVVSATALSQAGAVLESNDREGQERLVSLVEPRPRSSGQAAEPFVRSFRELAESCWGWSFDPEHYAGTEERPIPPELEHLLENCGEVLRPHFAVREPDPATGALPWQLLVFDLPPGEDFDRIPEGATRFEASHHQRLERLLRQKRVPAGILWNGYTLRLLSAPHGESSGWIDFHVRAMVETAGRPIATALRLLLKESRLLTLPPEKRLSRLLEQSRKYQNTVSERLAEQVLHALYELLRGFQDAHDRTQQELLREALREHPDEVYRALLTVLLRLIFLLYAEERDLLPRDKLFLEGYSLAGLYERLREDAARHPDTMGERYGAWAQLVALFRMVHDGAESDVLRLPQRHGVLFDPERFPFLEGRARIARQHGERLEPPLVSDGTIHRVLENLLVLGGERISYRALDVEQIGAVYETMMGFRLERASGRSVAIKPAKARGAPTSIDLEALLRETGAKRAQAYELACGKKPGEKVAKALASATSVEDLHAALERLIDRRATPELVSPGAMVLQPSEERRRSGSHYTPRALTEPIVRKTLEPLLQRLRGADGALPRPEQILSLHVCDPAMGSGAFLVETCRQLGEALVASWHAHRAVPKIPPDEDEQLHARRIIAQRCLYGVDKNPVAVDLAKVSLWLATLAKEHALTFLDHALRHGDSLVGLSRVQLQSFDWKSGKRAFAGLRVAESLRKVTALREQIRAAGDRASDTELRSLWRAAEDELDEVRFAGDLVVSAFFDGKNEREREERRLEFAGAVYGPSAQRYRAELRERREGERSLVPFPWEIEFPEVFERETPGFEAFVGNPPFAGKNTIAASTPENYPAWLQALHAESHGNADLVAHFFRRAFDLLCPGGTLGLIATNTIAQGDTRGTGLRWICEHSGTIYSAERRVVWPGLAAVVVSVVHLAKGAAPVAPELDERPVEQITAYLFHRGSHADPAALLANRGKSFQGSVVLGMGFTFDDTDTSGVATPLAEMQRLLVANPKNQEVIFPYIGGEEVNSSPTHAHHRYVIHFGERSEEECRRRWPELMAIVEEKVKPGRMKNNREVRKKYWWRFGETTPALFAAIAGLDRVLVTARVSQSSAFAFLPGGTVVSEQLIAFPLATTAAFCALQSRPHELWARFFGSSMKDDPRYTPSTCFETFPFPAGWESNPALEAAGRAYYEFRAALMIRNNEGLTQTYNRFHDRDEHDPEIERLRELHAAMDRAVLDAYGWSDLDPACEFPLDYEIDEEEWGNKKQPRRHRWPDDVRDEVLARLLELNAERAREEKRVGITREKPVKATRRRTTPKAESGPTLFGDES